jgi:hypothetical protein
LIGRIFGSHIATTLASAETIGRTMMTWLNYDGNAARLRQSKGRAMGPNLLISGAVGAARPIRAVGL